MSIKRIQELYNYKPSKSKINESFDTDTREYICIGEVNGYYPWYDSQGKQKVYIMVSPDKIMRYGEKVFDIRYTENSDGSGKQIDTIPSYAVDKVSIYPQYQDNEYGELFLGKKKEEDVLEQEHSYFESMLFKIDGNVVLHHNSSYKNEEGIIKRGKQNAWSNNSDKGIYFWASRNSGNDPSNAGIYTYYCLISRDELYDFETNEERLTLEQAMRKHKYVGQKWQNEDIVVVNTYMTTPIWCILDKKTGTWYDHEWNEIHKPF